ncbi:hypothetical protein [Methyloceanibacter sp.]|uniref:hypothetical protein n=1 Tax=Methyloceanibacter sp. TaxID=1965321 RepID=UPI003D6C8B35
MSASTELVASLPFFSYRQRNAVIDNFFYDTASLTLEEKAKLSPLVDREGSIIVVPPSNSDRQIRHYKRALRFMNKEGRTIRAIAVAGVGSSALGTAALARNVADALDTDVAGIVTGYGLSDVMTEALGGWFAFGAADRIRNTMEKFLERLRSPVPADIAAGSDASATLSEILLADPPKLECLLAHSKGSLVASHALQHYVEDVGGDDSPLFDRLRITTLGTVVGLPAAFKKVKQYLGALDWYGGTNSSLGVTHERVPGAGHHLNPGLPCHLSVAALLNGGTASRLLPEPSMTEVFAPLSIPPVAAALQPMAAVKSKEAVRSSAKKAAKSPSPAPRGASGSPKVASAATRVASPAAKVSAAPKAASLAPRAAVPIPKPTIGAVKQASAAAKPAAKLMPRKVIETRREPMSPAKAKTVAANGKLAVKKSKKGER